MKGLVIRNTGYSYTVRADESGTLYECKVKGNFRIKGIRTTNPVAIGDRVEFTPQQEENAGLIVALEDRRNYIIRKSTNLSKQSHILAANVDQCFLIVTVTQPETSLTFIDRFLASAEAYRVPVVLVFNKTDVLDGEWQAYLDGVVNLYETVGYACRRVSAVTGDGVESLRRELQGRVTLLSGNSGVGKSTLINALFPGLNLKTSEISEAYNTGKHTTTFSEMFPIESEGESRAASGGAESSATDLSPTPLAHPGYIIDTPGIKGFGTFDMEREEIGHYFKDIFRFSAGCRFSNCTHTHEPHCAVREAVERHDISLSRYNSYLSMLEDENEDKYRAAY